MFYLSKVYIGTYKCLHNKPRTMGTGRRTDVVTVNMQWVDIKKNWIQIFTHQGFFASFHHRPSGLDVYWVTSESSPGFPPLVGRIHFPRCVLCSADVRHRAAATTEYFTHHRCVASFHHRPSGFGVRRPHQPPPLSAEAVLRTKWELLLLRRYHLPLLGLRVASTKMCVF